MPSFQITDGNAPARSWWALALAAMMGLDAACGQLPRGNALVVQDNFIRAARANDPEGMIRWGEQLLHTFEASQEVSPALFDTLLQVFKARQIREEFAEAAACLDRAETVAIQLFGKESQNYAVVLFNRGSQLLLQSRAAEAGRQFEASRQLTSRLLGERHPSLGNALQQLASVSYTLGDHARAEQYHLQALEIRMAGLPLRDPQIGHSYEGLGKFYFRRGEYDKSLECLHKAAEIYLSSLSERNPISSEILVSLGNVYKRKGDPRTAVELMRRALAMQESALGANHPNLGRTLAALGGVFSDVGQFEEALRCSEKALEINLAAKGPQDLTSALYSSGAGFVLTRMGRYAEAESRLTEALAALEPAGAEYPAHLATVLSNAGLLAWFQERIGAAADLLARSNALDERLLRVMLGAGAESDKMAVLLRSSSRSQLICHFAMQAGGAHPKWAELGMTVVLQRKGRTEDVMSACHQAARNRLTPGQREALDELIQVRGDLAKTSFGRRASGNRSALQAREAQLERMLSWTMARTLLVEPEITVAAVQQAVPDDSLLIEYVLVRPYDPSIPKIREHEIPWRYAACTLSRNGAPRWHDLGTADAIHGLLLEHRRALLQQDAGAKSRT